MRTKLVSDPALQIEGFEPSKLAACSQLVGEDRTAPSRAHRTIARSWQLGSSCNNVAAERLVSSMHPLLDCDADCPTASQDGRTRRYADALSGGR